MWLLTESKGVFCWVCGGDGEFEFRLKVESGNPTLLKGIFFCFSHKSSPS